MQANLSEHEGIREDERYNGADAWPSRAQTDVRTSAPTESWKAFLAAAPHLNNSRMLYALVFKRWIDVSVGLLSLAASSPLLFAVSLALWLESRTSPFYLQPRMGRNGLPFTVYKFRTMIPDRREPLNEYNGSDRRVRHKSPNDPRVTKLGRLLRATSVDELPQLINVVKGEMSLVGPRPELLQIVKQYEPWQHERHVVKPGLTGWWQIHGRSELPMHENTELDIYYVEHLSLKLDVQIVFKTMLILLKRTGAF